jgi:hypothetical protein
MLRSVVWAVRPNVSYFLYKINDTGSPITTTVLILRKLSVPTILIKVIKRNFKKP